MVPELHFYDSSRPMYEEPQLIPFQTSSVPAGKSLVFAPHPDDETFGLGGTILQMTEQGNEVVVVLVTDGSQAGDSNQRKEEFLTATQLLGVEKKHFLGLVDRKVKVTTQNVSSVCEIISAEQPDNIFFTSPFEYHIDHRSTAWLVWSALQQLEYQGNIYAYEVGNQSPANLFIDITGYIERKQELMSLYKSQAEFNDYSRKITAINESRSYTLPKEVKYAEAFYRFNSVSDNLTIAYHTANKAFEQGFSSISLPKVSVLIRTKNRPEALRTAITSVVKQTYPNIEINCLNDGGDDISEVTSSFKNRNIQVQQNKFSNGRAAAANQLLAMAGGDFLIFLDDDDSYDLDHIENLVKELQQNPNSKVVYSGVRVGSIEAPKFSFNQSYNPSQLRKGNYIPIHAVLFSKDLLKTGCRFDENFEVYEDWDFWLQLSQETPFLHSNKVTATYNLMGNSGAGVSESRLDKNEWKLKVYEKWMKRWSADQLDQTFTDIDENTSRHIQNITAQMEHSQHLLSEKEKQLATIKNENENKLEQLLLNKRNLESTIKNQNQVANHIINHMVMSHAPEALSGYRFCSARSHIEGCMELFENVFNEKMSIEFWNWKYTGALWRGVCALDDHNKVIGFYGGMVNRFLAFGKPVNAIQACDIMISSASRTMAGKGSLFNSLFTTFSKINLNTNSDLYVCYGFPHARHFKLGARLGIYNEADRISQISWPLAQPSSYADTTSEIMSSDEDISGIWESMKTDFEDQVIKVRDAHYINRRYISHPKFNYAIHMVKNSENQIIGAAVLKDTTDSIMLMDIIGKKEHFSSIISQAHKIAFENFNKPMTAWITTTSAHLLETPDSQTNKTDIIVPVNFSKEMENYELIKNRWFLMYGDTDFI